MSTTRMSLLLVSANLETLLRFRLHLSQLRRLRLAGVDLGLATYALWVGLVGIVPFLAVLALRRPITEAGPRLEVSSLTWTLT